MNQTLAYILVIGLGCAIMAIVTFIPAKKAPLHYDLDILDPDVLFVSQQVFYNEEEDQYKLESVFCEPADWEDIVMRTYRDICENAERRSAMIDWENEDWF